jgi:hypothetical protein
MYVAAGRLPTSGRYDLPQQLREVAVFEIFL